MTRARGQSASKETWMMAYLGSGLIVGIECRAAPASLPVLLVVFRWRLSPLLVLCGPLQHGAVDGA